MASTHFVRDNTYLQCWATSIGCAAFRALSKNQAALVAGVTSRGIFIQSPGQRITFISFEPYRGPLTVTLAEIPTPLRPVEIGAAVQISAGKLILPTAGLIISAASDAVWSPSTAAGSIRPLLERRTSLKNIAQEVVALQEGTGLSALLPPLLAMPPPKTVSNGQQQWLTQLVLLRQALADRNVSQAVETIAGFLGRGYGLTPAGDDIIVGLLLGLNRWPIGLWLERDLLQLNQRVLETAYQKTTTLSANLIECAAFGQADERLINVVDCIFSGKPEAAESIAGLLTWGASSGIAALVGLAVAVTYE